LEGREGWKGHVGESQDARGNGKTDFLRVLKCVGSACGGGGGERRLVRMGVEMGPVIPVGMGRHAKGEGLKGVKAAGGGGGRRAEGLPRRMQRNMGRGPGYRHGALHKQRLLSTPKEHWPRIGVLGGLSMACLGPSPHGLEFMYTHSEAYEVGCSRPRHC
jgi:hypothetical protein